MVHSSILINVTAHQMVWSNLRQTSCGGEALTNVPFGAEARLHRNGIHSRNKRLKLSDSSSSWAEQAWKQHSGVTLWRGDLRSDDGGGIVAHSRSPLRWHRTRALKAPLSDQFIPPPPASPRSPPPTEPIHLPLSLSVCLYSILFSLPLSLSSHFIHSGHIADSFWVHFWIPWLIYMLI